MFLKMKRSPGFAWVIPGGITRESQQVINRASGDCPRSASLRKRSLFSLQYFFRNRWTPLISFSMAPPLPGADTRNRGRLGAGGNSSVPAFDGYFIRYSSPLKRDIIQRNPFDLYQCARWTGRLILTPFFTGPFRPGTKRRGKTMGRLEALCSRICDTHHVYLREHLPRLAALIVRENGNIDPPARGAMKTIAERFRALSGEITSHLMKEEQILFPTILSSERALGACRRPDRAYPERGGRTVPGRCPRRVRFLPSAANTRG